MKVILLSLLKLKENPYSIRFPTLEGFTSKVLIALSKSKLRSTVPVIKLSLYQNSDFRKKGIAWQIHGSYQSSEACCAALYLFSICFCEAKIYKRDK